MKAISNPTAGNREIGACLRPGTQGARGAPSPLGLTSAPSAPPPASPLTEPGSQGQEALGCCGIPPQGRDWALRDAEVVGRVGSAGPPWGMCLHWCTGAARQGTRRRGGAGRANRWGVDHAARVTPSPGEGAGEAAGGLGGAASACIQAIAVAFVSRGRAGGPSGALTSHRPPSHQESPVLPAVLSSLHPCLASELLPGPALRGRRGRTGWLPPRAGWAPRAPERSEPLSQKTPLGGQGPLGPGG